MLLGCSGGGAPDAEPEAVRPAKIISLENASNQRVLSFPAVVQAAQSAELTFEVPGEIIELPVREAQPVKKGDLIARIDPVNARNAVAQARAEYANAQTEFQRAERLYDQDAISRSVLDQRRTQRDVAKVALANAEDALDETDLRAPFDGAVSRVYPEAFQIIQAKEPIVVVQSDDVEAVTNVPSSIIARLPRLETVGTVVTLDAADGREFPAELTEAAGIADPSTQTYKVAFAFEPPDDLFVLPGMTGTVRTTLIAKGIEEFVGEGIAVPLSAILAEGDDRFVWVVAAADGALSKRAVSVSNAAGDNVVVTSGLTGDEQIVSSGVSFLNEGMKVRPWRPE